MDSYMEPHFHTNHNQHNSGLLRFRSAPSSLFNEFMTRSPADSDTRYGDDFFELKPQMSGSPNGYSGSGRLPPQYPKQHSGSRSSTIQRSNSLEIGQPMRQENGGGIGLNLDRQNSSPAGFFNHLIDPQNVMRGCGHFGVGNGTNSESSLHLSRLGMHHLPQIPEITNENIKETSPDNDVIKITNQEDDAGFDSPAARFSFTSNWNDSGSDSSHLSENGRLTTRPNSLRHQLSLPKTSAEMAAVEKLFHFQDTVPCKVRAKRGCATHPRSIAERVRRNRISERMRKLMELVPNMDKQTNTADMLDLAVEYIKELQNHHKVLSHNRAKCKCINPQQH